VTVLDSSSVASLERGLGEVEDVLRLLGRGETGDDARRLEQVVFAAVDASVESARAAEVIVMMDLLSGKKKAAPEGAACGWLRLRLMGCRCLGPAAKGATG
jgi:hypothetical protein